MRIRVTPGNYQEAGLKQTEEVFFLTQHLVNLRNLLPPKVMQADGITMVKMRL